ncbi:MAG: Gfo/Idh/MocA family oxidoreductase [Bryobacteraceae bacterium]
MASNHFSRRLFFQGALLAGAVPAGGFGSTPSLKQAGFRSPNEKLNIASIGAGGRAADDIQGCSSENIVALTDPDSARAAANFKTYEKAPKYTDFRKMLDKEEKTIDAVIIAIPDFMHGTAAMWCMERGKHAYVEKPLTKTIWEARQLKEAAAKYGVVTQMGNQHVSEEGTRQVCEIIWSGEIGNVTEVHAWTNRPIWPQGMTELPTEEKVPDTLDWDAWLGIQEPRPYSSAYLPFNWRGWKDFGTGPIGDELIHTLGAPNLALRLTAPSSVEVTQQEGKNPYSYAKSTITKWEFPARGPMPPVTLYWYDASTGARYRPPALPEDEPVIPPRAYTFPRPPEADGGGAPVGGAGRANIASGAPAAGGGQGAGRGAGAGGRGSRQGGDGGGNRGQNQGVVFVGDKGYLAAGGEGTEGGVALLPAARMKDYTLPRQSMWRSPGHYVEWIMACKGSNPRTMSDFAFAAPLAETVLLGVVALNVEGKLEYDAEKGIFTNNKEANKYLQPPHFRKGWSFT